MDTHAMKQASIGCKPPYVQHMGSTDVLHEVQLFLLC